MAQEAKAVKGRRTDPLIEQVDPPEKDDVLELDERKDPRAPAVE
jgi:hypothetical protein